MLLWDLVAYSGDQLIDVRSAVGASIGCDADGPEQHVRQLERTRLGDVEPGQEPPTNEVQVAAHRRAGVAVQRAQLLEHMSGVSVGIKQLTCARVLGDGRNRSEEHTSELQSLRHLV